MYTIYVHRTVVVVIMNITIYNCTACSSPTTFLSVDTVDRPNRGVACDDVAGDGTGLGVVVRGVRDKPFDRGNEENRAAGLISCCF